MLLLAGPHDPQEEFLFNAHAKLMSRNHIDSLIVSHLINTTIVEDEDDQIVLGLRRD